MNANNNAPPERGPLDEISDWFASIPPVTRALFCGSLGLSVVAKFGVFDLRSQALFWELVVRRLEIWRLVTSFLGYPMGWNYFMTLYFLYRYSGHLEQSTYARRRADYVFLVLFCMVAALPIAIMFQVRLLLDVLVMSLIYLWAMDAGDQQVQFFFGIQFKAFYLPIALIAFDILTNNPGYMDKVIGAVVGHLFYFLDKIYPSQNNGQRILSTPAFLQQLLGDDAAPGGAPAAAGAGSGWFGGLGRGRGQTLGGRPGSAAPRAAPAAPAGGYRPVPSSAGNGPNVGGPRDEVRHRWGSGQRLGTE
ncbi:Derlin 1 [Phlyctochytrium bullatum]|nr:Derlin 1 [Phlyctochytrium bullatum]